MRVTHFSRRISLLMTLLLLSPNAARACGGFFCTTFPMNQVSEQILFVADQGTVTTHVQIQYTGSAADFAWVLPVPSLPDLKVSHNEVFRQLQFATQPSFVLNWPEEGQDCGIFWPVSLGGTAEEVDFDSGVEVVSEERVGPYDTAVITADDPGAITAWLTDNGYRLDDLGSELLKPYVEENFYFVALKLAPGREIGDLQPLALTYAADQPGIPIRLTAVATQPDLGVLVWVLGSHRAIPTNYLHVQINEARIDWFNGGINYNEVVTEAADEAGGQAFATDYAGVSEIMKDRFFQEGRYDLDKLRLLKAPEDFLAEMLGQGFPRDNQTQALIRRHIALPQAVLDEGVLEVYFRGDEAAYQKAKEDGTLQGLAEQSFYNNMSAYKKYAADVAFDPGAFADDLNTVVVEPLRVTQALFGDFPYLTRLYTTLSAEEMTVDPMFSFNPDLPEVSNMHTADARFECPEGDPGEVKPEDVVLVVTLADGRTIRTRPYASQGPGPFPRQPPPEGLQVLQSAVAVVEQMDTSGSPVPVRGMTIASDFDGDGSVGFDDFVLFAGAFGRADARFDLTGDGWVNFEDFVLFAQSFGQSVSKPAGMDG